MIIGFCKDCGGVTIVPLCDKCVCGKPLSTQDVPVGTRLTPNLAHLDGWTMTYIVGADLERKRIMKMIRRLKKKFPNSIPLARLVAELT